jgi:IMP dehydrogenase
MFFKFDDAVAANYQLTLDDILLDQAPSSDINSRYGSNIDPYYMGRLPIVGAPMPSIACRTFLEAAETSRPGAPDRPFIIFADRFRPLEEQIDLWQHGAGMSVGLDDDWFTVVARAVEYDVSHILIDIANGNLDSLVTYLGKLQDARFDDNLIIWAGNVTNAKAYARIADLCDYVRVGIGGGSACTTRLGTGVGAGNATAIARCAEMRRTLASSHPPNSIGPAAIVADGGIKNNGDICKALACGADLVMLGKMFAATQESAAASVFNKADGLWYKEYAGLASSKYNSKSSIEGVAGLIPQGPNVTTLLQSIDGNLRSAMSYTNSHTLEEFKHSTKLLCSSTITVENNPSLVR